MYACSEPYNGGWELKGKDEYLQAQTWNMIAPPKPALITRSLFDQSSKLLLLVEEVTENNRLSMETKNVVWTDRGVQLFNHDSVAAQ